MIILCMLYACQPLHRTKGGQVDDQVLFGIVNHKEATSLKPTKTRIAAMPYFLKHRRVRPETPKNFPRTSQERPRYNCCSRMLDPPSAIVGLMDSSFGTMSGSTTRFWRFSKRHHARNIGETWFETWFCLRHFPISNGF